MRLSRLTLLAALMMLAALLTVCGGEESTTTTSVESSDNTNVASTADVVEDEPEADEPDTSVVGELSEPSSTTEELFITANSSESAEVDLMAGDVLTLELAMEGHSTGGSRADTGQAGAYTQVTVSVLNEYDEVVFLQTNVEGEDGSQVHHEGAKGQLLDSITIQDSGTHTISVFNPLLLQGISCDLTYHINQ